MARTKREISQKQYNLSFTNLGHYLSILPNNIL